MGLGTIPTLTVLIFYAFYPILRSTYAGFQNIPPDCQEAADSLGFSSFQKIWFVELPLAAPVLISGVRIATASIIGITTIAAFVGAGGLGDFITQGLALNSTPLILLGSIPTAFLALGFDYGLSRFEKHLHHRKEKRKSLGWISFFLLGSSICYFFVAGGYFFLREYVFTPLKPITIASKNFTEQYILAELMAQLIEAKTDLKVTRKLNLGASDIVHKALIKGEVDLYPEYSGTAYLTILKESWSPQETNIFEKVRQVYKEKYNLIWLDPFGFSNSQSLAIKKELAKEYKVTSLTDLENLSPQLKIAAPPEFLKRADGFPNLSKAYGLKFKSIVQIDISLLYTVIRQSKIDVIVAFTTDGKIPKYNLVILKDNKNFYPPYHAAPVIRKEICDAYPEIQVVLSPLLGLIDDKKMRDLNYEVDVKVVSPQKAAHTFLLKHHLL